MFDFKNSFFTSFFFINRAKYIFFQENILPWVLEVDFVQSDTFDFKDNKNFNNSHDQQTGKMIS